MEALLITGDGHPPTHLLGSYPLPSGVETNPLCTRIHQLPPNPLGDPLSLVLTGGVAGTVGWAVLNMNDGGVVCSDKVYGFSGPVLCLSISPCGRYVAAGCMDGSLGLLFIEGQGEELKLVKEDGGIKVGGSIVFLLLLVLASVA